MANDSELFKQVLNSVFSQQYQPKPVANTDLAQFVLAHSFKVPTKADSLDIAAKQGASGEQPGFLSKVFDTLATPVYATEGILSGIAKDTRQQHSDNKPDNPFTDIVQPIGSAFKHLVPNVLGNLARSASDVGSIAGQVTGLDHAPVAGKLIQGADKGLSNIADSMAPRKMGSDVLGEFGVKNKVAKYGGGFALDVLTDPTTYLTFGAGAAGKASKLADAAHGYRSADEALNLAAASGQSADAFIKPAVPTITHAPTAEQALGKNLIPKTETSVPAAALPPKISDKPNLLQTIFGDPTVDPQNLTDLKSLRASDNAKRAANVRWGRPADFHDLPTGMTPEEKGLFADQMRSGKIAKAGKVTDGKGNISQQAVGRVLQDIQDGATPRFAPPIEPATGLNAERAQEVANRIAENLTKQTRKGRSVKELTPADQANLYNSVRNAAADIVNGEGAAANIERAAAAKSIKLKPTERAVVTALGDHAKGLGKSIEPETAAKYIEQNITDGYITKAEGARIKKYLFPESAAIQNPAVTKAGIAATNVLARSMLRSAEDHLISQGIHPVYWNGTRARLSDIMSELGPGAESEYGTALMDALKHSDTRLISNPDVQAAINKTLARRSLSVADLLGSLSQKTVEAKQAVTDAYSTPVAKKILDGMANSAADAGAARGLTAAEMQAFRDHVGNIINIDKIPPEMMLDRVPRELADAVMHGTVDADQAVRLSRVLTKALNENPNKLMKDITGNKVVDAVMTRFSTYFGRIPELKRFEQDAFLHAEINANLRTAWLRHISTSFTKDQLYRGFRYAQSDPALLAAESDPAVKQVAGIFTDYFNAMLGSTGFDKITDIENVAAVRSSMTMTDVNKHLRALNSDKERAFQFTDKIRKKARLTGKPRDYTKDGVGWMRSWEEADPLITGQDPISLIHDIDVALQRTVAEYNLFDEFGRRFGAKVTDHWYDPSIHQANIPNPRLHGLLFHPEVQKAFMRQIKDLENGAWMPNNKTMRMITKATRAWKSSVTIYYPAHHIRNLIGDAYNMWWAGINDPRVFDKSLKVLKAYRHQYGEAMNANAISGLENVFSKDALDLIQKGERLPNASSVVVNKNGVKLTADQIWAAAHSRGLLLNYNKVEDLFGETPGGALFGTSAERTGMARLAKPFGGRAHHVAARVSENREHYVRLAHFIGSIENQAKKSKNIEDIFDEAAHTVRKWHPDGSDLTQFEQKARIVIPFYAWTRKEIPLLLQTMIQKPAKLVAYPKIQRAVAGASGIDVNDNQGLLDPYPNNQLFPYWIRATGIGPIGDPESNNAVAQFWGKFGAHTIGFSGQNEGYTVINPSNPFGDVANQLFGFGRPQDSLRAMSNSLTPGLSVPMDLIANQTFSGAPISKESGGQGYGSFLASQIPQVGTFTRLTGMGKDQKPDRTSANTQNLINFLTALGIRGTGPYQKSAEFEAKARSNYGG